MLIRFKEDQKGRASQLGWGPFEVVYAGHLVDGSSIYKFKYYDKNLRTWKTANLFQWRFDIVEYDITIEDLL